MNQEHIPLLESDPNDGTVLTPLEYLEKWSKFTSNQIPKAPKYGVVTFRYMGLADYSKERFEVAILHEKFPYPIFSFKDMTSMFVHIPVVAPAAVMAVEELLAIGVKCYTLWASWRSN